MCFGGKFTASQTVPAYAAPVRQSVRRAWCKDRIHHLPSTTDHRYSTPHQDHHHRSRSCIMRSRRDDHHIGRAASMIAFLGSVRALAATRRYANIRGARHHGLDRGPGRRRRDPHPASATAPRIVPAPRLVWTRPRGSPRGYYRGTCPRSRVLCVSCWN